MATTRFWSLKGNIVKALDYVLDLKDRQRKTGGGSYIETNMTAGSPALAGYMMKNGQTSRNNKNVGYHFQISLPVGEGDEQVCMEIAREWMDRISGGQAQYVVAVHNNTNNIHAHIIADAYLKNGKQWEISWIKEKNRFRSAADQVCKEHGLSVLENEYSKGMTYKEWMDRNAPDSKHAMLKKTLDYVIPRVSSMDDLKSYMRAVGFKIYDDVEKQKMNEKFFEFTADIKIIETQSNGVYHIRIPYDPERHKIEVDPTEFEWIKENKTARIRIPTDKLLNYFDQKDSFLDRRSCAEIKGIFEQKRKKGRKDLRFKVPESKKCIRASHISRDEDYSREAIIRAISRNGRTETDPKIAAVIAHQNDWSYAREARRHLFEVTGINAQFQGKEFYKVASKQNYYKWKAAQIEKRLDRMHYRNLLEKDRQNLDKLKARRAELAGELKGCQQDLEQFDRELQQLMLDRVEDVAKVDETVLTKRIEETKGPLLERKDQLRQMINLYDQRISNAEYFQKEEEKKSVERVRTR